MLERTGGAAVSYPFLFAQQQIHMNATRAPAGGAEVAAIAADVRERVGSADSGAAETFAKLACTELSPEELARRGNDTWAALCLDLFQWFRTRPADGASVRTFNPDRERNGWTCPHSVIQVVTDDMPFLVDSLEMAIAGAGLRLHRLLHPVMDVRRNQRGDVVAISPCQEGGSTESVMHAEIDRVDEAIAWLRR